MLRVTGFRLLMLAVVLGIAVASVAGVTFSSNSAGGQGVVTAIRYSDAVRFTVQDEKVAVLRASARGIFPSPYSTGQGLRPGLDSGCLTPGQFRGRLSIGICLRKPVSGWLGCVALRDGHADGCADRVQG